MAKHYTKKHEPQRRVPWALVAVAAALALIVIGILVLTRPSGTPVTTAGNASGPRIAVDRERIDFGKVKMNQPVTAAFKVKNAGTAPLQIVGQPAVRVVEGCWPPRAVVGSTTINPGQETDISMTFTMHPGMEGPHDFRVDLRTNDPVRPTTELAVLSEWVK